MRERGAGSPRAPAGHGLTRGWAAAAGLVAAALSLSGAGPPERVPPPGSALAVALDALALTPDDLAQPAHLLPPDPWRLPMVEALLRRPLQSVAVVRGLALALAGPGPAPSEAAGAASGPPLAEAIRAAAEALDVRWVPPAPGPAEPLEVQLLEARRALRRPGGARDAARIRRAVAALPAGVREGTARILAAQRRAAELLREALGGVGQAERAELLAWLAGLAQGRYDADDPAHRRALGLASRIDRGALVAAAWLVADAVDRALPDLLHGAADPAIPRRPGALLLDEPTPWGRVVIAGAGPNRHARDAFLLIDLGGDDQYTNNAGGTGARRGGIAVAIDLGGNDRYRTDRDGAQGAGLFGVGILVDVGGDDTYEAGRFSQGAGLFGVGILADGGGDDRYAGRALVQGAAAFGLGLLRDGAGNDRYRAAMMAQGFGLVAGFGVLAEGAGDDAYVMEGGVADPRQPGHAQSFGQGMGMGLRPHASGGIGLLVDRGGDDTYRADYFAQGVAYWFGLGGLVDEAGHDGYAASRYAQGAGIHLAVGVLADAAGDDRYEAHGVAQGAGHDWAVGILMDGAGDDRYRVVSLGQGAGSANGVGLLIDVQGRDTLQVPGATVQGCGLPSRGYPSIGILLTHEASVLGLPLVEGRATRRCGDLGLTTSALGLPAGLPWEPAALPPADGGRPRAEAGPARPPAAWPAGSGRTVDLLRQAADPGESPEAAARRRAARRALLADPATLPVLLAALGRDEPAIASAALDLLVESGAPAAAAAADLLRHPDPRLRRRAAWVLKAGSDPGTRPALLHAARDDADPLVRAYALEGLRPWNAGGGVRDVLVAALGAEREWVVRLGAARGLEGAGAPPALAALAGALGDAHYGVRAAARAGLQAAGPAARAALAARAARPPGGDPLEAIARRHAEALLRDLDERAP